MKSSSAWPPTAARPAPPPSPRPRAPPWPRAPPAPHPRSSAPQPGSWLVSYWGGKASTTTPPTWTPPTNATRRTGANAAGANLVTGILADSKVPWRSAPSARAWHAPASPSPTASCSRSWSAPASRRQPRTGRRLHLLLRLPRVHLRRRRLLRRRRRPADLRLDLRRQRHRHRRDAAHTYAKTGTRNVTLTVNDGKTTTSLTKPVAATYAEPLPGHTSLVPETPRTDCPSSATATSTTSRSSAPASTSSAPSPASPTSAPATPRRTRSASWRPTTSAPASSTPTSTPTFDGNAGFAVDAVEASPDGTRVYVAGGFNTVNGVTSKGVVQLDPDTGDTVTGFTADTDARATELAVSGSTVYIGGRFGKVNDIARKSLAAVDALTGAVDTGFVNNLSGGIGVNGGLTVQKLLLTHDGGKLVVDPHRSPDQRPGPLRHRHHRHGHQAAAPLAHPPVGREPAVRRRHPAHHQRLDRPGRRVVRRLERLRRRPPADQRHRRRLLPRRAGNDVQPRWISRAFDSVYTTAISEKAVYIGGHFAWNESPSAPTPLPGAADVGYGTGQGLSGYGLGDSVVGPRAPRRAQPRGRHGAGVEPRVELRHREHRDGADPARPAHRR